METFETQVVVNAETVKEIRRYLLSRNDKLSIFSAALMLYIIGFALFWFFLRSYVVIYLIVAPWPSILYYRFIIKRQCDLFGKLIKERYHQDSFTLITSLKEEGFGVNNIEARSESISYYKDIKRFVETKNFYLFITRANYHIFANKNKIIEEGKAKAFFEVLRAKGLKMKMSKDL